MNALKNRGGSMVGLLALAMLLLPGAASAASCQSRGGNTLCVSSAGSISGSNYNLARVSGAVHQTWCGSAGTYHVQYVVKDNSPTYDPPGVPGGITKWSWNTPNFTHQANPWLCTSDDYGDGKFLPNSPNVYRNFPRGWKVCAILWKHNGGNNYSATVATCQKF